MFIKLTQTNGRAVLLDTESILSAEEYETGTKILYMVPGDELEPFQVIENCDEIMAEISERGLAQL